MAVQQLVKEAPFKVNHSTDYHCTVMYSKVLAPEVKLVDQALMGFIKEVTHWIDHRGRNIVVAQIDSLDLQSIHNDLAAQGLEHSYTSYNPHITLGYDVGHIGPAARLWVNRMNERLSQRPLRISFDPCIRGSSLS